MLKEDDVVDAVCDWLRARGWTIESFRHGTQQGDDVVAVGPAGERLLVECKGSQSPRTGNQYGTTQCWNAAAGAIFNTIRDIERGESNVRNAIALPATESYKAMLKDLEGFFVRNRLTLLWVSADGAVAQHGAAVVENSGNAT